LSRQGIQTLCRPFPIRNLVLPAADGLFAAAGPAGIAAGPKRHDDSRTIRAQRF
jgi:hypothetical protein